MSQPKVTLSEIDGALGVLPEGTGRAFAVCGVATDGPIATPAAFGTPEALQAIFGKKGPAVAAACLYIAVSGKPVVFCRTGDTTLGAYLDEVEGEDGTISALDNTGVDGTSDFSDNASDPLLAGEWQVVALAGGTRGTAGIVFQVFRDEVSFGIYPLGTAVNFDLGGGSGVSLALSAGTIISGDIATFETEAPIEASAGELVIENPGSASVSLTAVSEGSIEPNDDYEIKVVFDVGATVGVAGALYRESLDGGRTFGQQKALGTANFLVVDAADQNGGTGGVRIDFGGGTILDDETISFPTVAPKWNSSDLSDALTALKQTEIDWEICHVVGPLEPADVDAVDLKLADKRHSWVGSTRLPVGDESDATYQASLSAAFNDTATVYGELCSGAWEPVDAITGRKYRRPAAFGIASAEGSVSEEIDIADPNRPPLKGKIRDSAGNPKHHDESINPGLDDARFSVLRTWEDFAGVYPNRPRIFSPAGSDFYLMPHRRLLNLAHITIKAYMTRRLNQPLVVSRKTGYLTEAEALEIESGGNAALATVFGTKKSSAYMALNRTDNILSSHKVTGRYRVIPPAYIEEAELEGGFENPALNLTTV